MVGPSSAYLAPTEAGSFIRLQPQPLSGCQSKYFCFKATDVRYIVEIMCKHTLLNGRLLAPPDK